MIGINKQLVLIYTTKKTTMVFFWLNKGNTKYFTSKQGMYSKEFRTSQEL